MENISDIERLYGLALSYFVVNNPDYEFSSDQLGAFIYQIRAVADYDTNDVNIVCGAMKILIEKLAKIPNRFCAEIWMAIISAITNAQMDEEWEIMAKETNLDSFATAYIDSVEKLFSIRHVHRSSAQISILCKKHVVRSGILRHVFSSIWDVNLEEIANKVCNEDWDSIKVLCDSISTRQAIKLFENDMFKSFSIAPDSKSLARDIYFSAIARLIINVSNIEDYKKGDCGEDFKLLNIIIKYFWYQLGDDSAINTHTLVGFDKLLMLGLSRNCVTQCVKLLENVCCSFKIHHNDICKQLEDTLWSCFYSMSYKYFDCSVITEYDFLLNELTLSTRIPTLVSPEDLQTENWVDTFCSKIPLALDRKKAEESALECKHMEIRDSLYFLLEVLVKSTKREEAIKLMTEIFPEFIKNKNSAVCAHVKNVYKSFVAREVISKEDQIAIVAGFIASSKYKEIQGIVSCTPENSDIGSEMANMYFEHLLQCIKSGKNEDEVSKKLESSNECNSFLVRYLSKDSTAHIVKDLAEILREECQDQKLTMQLFSIIVETCSPTEFSHRDEIGWYLDFNSINVSHDCWNNVFTKLADNNVKEIETKVIGGLTVLSMHQLTSDDLSLNELMYVLRIMEYQRSGKGSDYLKKFYGNDKNVQEAIEKFTSQDKAIKLCCRLLDLIGKSVIDENDWQFHANSLEKILNWFTFFDILEEKKVVCAMISLCNKISTWHIMHDIGANSELLSLEDIVCLSKTWKVDVYKKWKAQVEEAENDVHSFLKLCSERSPSGEPVLKRVNITNTGNEKDNSAPKTSRQEIQLISLFNDTCMQLLSFAESLKPELSSNHELFAWVIGVSNGGIAYTVEAKQKAMAIIETLCDSSEIEILQRIDLVYYVMMGLTGKDYTGSISLKSYFTSIYIIIQSNSMDLLKNKDVDEVDKLMGNLGYWLEVCADTKNKTYALTNEFMKKFGEFMEKEKALLDGFPKFSSDSDDAFAHSPISIIAEMFLSRISFLPDWLENATCPISLFSSMNTLINVLFSFPAAEKYADTFQSALIRSIDILLCEKSIEKWAISSLIAVQMTDKRLLSALEIKYILKTEKVVSSLRDGFELFSNYGELEVQKKMVAKITELFAPISSSISKHDQILKGNRKILDDKILIFNVMFATEMMDYCGSIARLTFQANRKHDELFEEIFMLSDDQFGAPNTAPKDKQAVKNELKSGRKSADKLEKKKEDETAVCTFVQTDSNFMMQHWYNCYTCRMTDTTGICSVCAVNCHRGHDISYSKKGSFFCDCGANRCNALTGASHSPNVSNAIRGQYPQNETSNCTVKAKTVFPYELKMMSLIDNKEMADNLTYLHQEIEKWKPNLETIISAIGKGNENSLNVIAKREAVLKSLEDVQKVKIVYDQVFMEVDYSLPENWNIVPARQPEADSERNSNGAGASAAKTCELADVVKLENGIEVWLNIPESTNATLNLHYMDTRTNMKNGLTHVRHETETLPFVGRRLVVSGNRVAICGVSEVVALRFSANGDIVNRTLIRLADVVSSTYNNQIVKAVWCHDHEKQYLAIATSQYVRLFDLTSDTAIFVEEMVVTTGNVQDVVILTDYISNNSVYVLVLSNSGFLYQHNIVCKPPDNNSIFLTNTITNPIVSQSGLGSGISLHYSKTYDLLFVTFEKGAFFTKIPRNEIGNDGIVNDQSWIWRKIVFNATVQCWKESAGIISCLQVNSPTNIIYITASDGHIFVQKMVMNRPILSQFLMTSSKNEAIYSVILYKTMPTVEICRTTYVLVRDLWIDDEPSEQVAIEMLTEDESPIVVDREDLVLINEGCEPITNLSWSSDDISMFYENADLNARLGANNSLPLFVIQKTSFTLTARITNPRTVVRGFRVECDGDSGPYAIKLNNQVYRCDSSRQLRFYDIRLTRSESLQLDRDIKFEIIAKPNQNQLCIKSFQLIGCDRDLMEEIKPIYYYQKIISVPNQFLAAYFNLSAKLFVGAPINDEYGDWISKIAARHLSRRSNHPNVCLAATKLLKRVYQDDVQKFFEVIDGSMLDEWKYLKEWKINGGMTELRKKHVELMFRRFEGMKTRWPIFENLVYKYFPTVLDLVKVMRQEMILLPRTSCPIAAEGLVRLILGFLAQYSKESEELTTLLLNLFTDDDTYQLTPEIRSAIQVSMYRYGWVIREDREKAKIYQKEGKMDKYCFLKYIGNNVFYGRSRIYEKTEENEMLLSITDRIEVDSYLEKGSLDLEFGWLDNLIRRTICMIHDNGAKNSMPQKNVPMTDQPANGLAMTAIVILGQYYSCRILPHFGFLIDRIRFDISDVYPLSEKSFQNFVLLRLLEVLIERWMSHYRKELTTPSSTVESAIVEMEKLEADSVDGKEKLELSRKTMQKLAEIAKILVDRGIMEMCYGLVENTLPYWKTHRKAPVQNPVSASEQAVYSNEAWMQQAPASAGQTFPYADQLHESHPSAEEAFVSCLSELSLRFPLVIQRIVGNKFDDNWYKKLCEIVYMPEVTSYRNCKKLLIAICGGDKQKYRMVRDKFKMQEYLDLLVQKYLNASGGDNGGHQQLTEIVDILTSLSSLATNRADMWRDICDAHTFWLLRLACYTSDVIASSVIDLIIIAVRDSSACRHVSVQLADRIVEADDGNLLLKIIGRFLIGRQEDMRWVVHGLLRSIIQLASRQNQASLVRRLYLEVFPEVRKNGSHAAQIVDLIATYAPRLFNSGELIEMCDAEMDFITVTANRIKEEGFDVKYRQFMEMGLGWKTMLLEQNPCLVCFNKKGAVELVKLATVKSDSKYTPNTIIYKLNSNYEISKVIVKLSEIKKGRLVKKVNLYYCAKSIDSVIDVKLSPELWRKCSHTTVSLIDTTATLSLAVPVITSSLIIEFEEVSDTSSSNYLHCPRCSIVVRNHSGVCENCGENAYQCIKCRSINYVEREPFLCQTCGFCKYARIDVMLMCRQMPGTQNIASDAERAQSMDEMSKLLIKMENTRAKLNGYKGYCEALWIRTRPLPPFNVHVENSEVSEFFGENQAAPVDFSIFETPISTLAQASYSIKAIHDEIFSQTEQLIAIHDELLRYDSGNETSVVFHKPHNYSYYDISDTCFSCMSSGIINSIALLQCVCEDETALEQLVSMNALYEIVGGIAMKYEPIREECEALLLKAITDNSDAMRRMEKMIDNGKLNISIIVKSLLHTTDSAWQQKLKFLIRYALNQNDEQIYLQTLLVLNKYLEEAQPIRQKIYKKVEELRNGKFVHSAKSNDKSINRVKVMNGKLASKDVVIKWLTSKEEWEECCAGIATTSTQQGKPSSIQFKWIVKCIFSPWMSVRASANKLLVNMSKQPGHEGIVLIMLVEHLQQLSNISPAVSDQFMHSAYSIIGASANVKARLFIRKFHVWLIRKIHEECGHLHKKENESLVSDQSFGLRLRCYVELLCLFFSGSKIENILLRAGADDLLVFLLQSTIFLKRLVTRRTRAIDCSRIALEKLLRRVSSRDGEKLMKACVESLKIMKDTTTIGIIVSVMMEVMDPQQNVEEDFQINIEKDAAQDEFLQGRMSGNPYKSSENGMGPLMRDIKNKICRDTEMIALMDDDNGMELLVCNNIISLALPVRVVYEKLWRRQFGATPMQIVYRMRGLMGDAVETFISTLDDDTDGHNEEDESLAQITRCLEECKGLDRLIELMRIGNDTSASRYLLSQLRRVFERIVKTSTGRNALVSKNAVRIIMNVIRECCTDIRDDSNTTIGLELYKVIETIVNDVNIHQKLVGIDDIDAKWIIDLYRIPNENGRINMPSGEIGRKTNLMLETMAASLGNLVIGSDESENVFVERLTTVFDWSFIDNIENINDKDEHSWVADQFSLAILNILPSESGRKLKQKILDSGIVEKTCSYFTANHPPLYSPTESSEWKQFLIRKSLKGILGLLDALARRHQAIQRAIATNTLPLLHRMEQVASESSVGPLAENVMEALNEDKEVAEKIKSVRLETKQKKKQLAMAMRNKQLSKMGMQIGKKGELKVASRNITNEPILDEVSDPYVCCICRESALTGTREAGVYAFGHLCTDSPDRANSVATVSQMVMVHYECHNNAIRRGGAGRNIDEWTKASLHNAGARCNMITPIGLGNTPLTQALQKYQMDYDRIVSISRPINRQVIFSDICNLMDRYIYKRPFFIHSQGGGRESNMQYLVILHLLGLNFEEGGNDLHTDLPRHRVISFLFTELSLENWNEQRHDILRASINDAVTSGTESSWPGLKPIVMFWSLIDKYFNKLTPFTGDDRVSWFRSNFSGILNRIPEFVQEFDENFLKCESIEEFCDLSNTSREDLVQFMEPEQLAPTAP